MIPGNIDKRFLDISMTFQQKDLEDLKKAKSLLENPGFAAKITNLLGTSIEKGFASLPQNWRVKIGEITQTALSKAIHAAVFTMKTSPKETASDLWHKLALATTGGIGGFFGLSAKAAAQAIPAIGAAGGAIINTLFVDHFQDMARGHFIVRRLERKYSREIVEETYKAV